MNHFPCLEQKYFTPSTFKGLAYFVSKAFTFNFFVVSGSMKGEISFRVHLSLALNNMPNLSMILQGRSSSENLLIMGGDFSLSTNTRPDSWSMLVSTPSGTALTKKSVNVKQGKIVSTHVWCWYQLSRADTQHVKIKKLQCCTRHTEHRILKDDF